MTSVGEQGDILAAGEDRCLYLYDVRGMKVKARWRSVAKHDVVGLLRSYQAPTARVYVAGMDNELMPVSLEGGKPNKMSTTTSGQGSVAVDMDDDQEEGGSMVQQRREHAPLPVGSRLHETHHLGVKSDARWVGVAEGRLCDDEDGLIGISDRGTVYVIENAQHMKASLLQRAQGPSG